MIRILLPRNVSQEAAVQDYSAIPVKDVRVRRVEEVVEEYAVMGSFKQGKGAMAPFLLRQ